VSLVDIFDYNMNLILDSDWLPAGYNIEHHFGRYFDDPLSFRVLQAQTGTIVSGSNALQFFER
jgi:hypothetical protein